MRFFSAPPFWAEQTAEETCMYIIHSVRCFQTLHYSYIFSWIGRKIMLRFHIKSSVEMIGLLACLFVKTLQLFYVVLPSQDIYNLFSPFQLCLPWLFSLLEAQLICRLNLKFMELVLQVQTNNAFNITLDVQFSLNVFEFYLSFSPHV